MGDLAHPTFTLPTIETYLRQRKLGRDVTLLRYADQYHTIHGPAAADLNERIMAFLKERLAK